MLKHNPLLFIGLSTRDSELITALLLSFLSVKYMKCKNKKWGVWTSIKEIFRYFYILALNTPQTPVSFSPFWRPINTTWMVLLLKNQHSENKTKSLSVYDTRQRKTPPSLSPHRLTCRVYLSVRHSCRQSSLLEAAQQLHALLQPLLIGHSGLKKSDRCEVRSGHCSLRRLRAQRCFVLLHYAAQRAIIVFHWNFHADFQLTNEFPKR